jgi:hypothetical protein
VDISPESDLMDGVVSGNRLTGICRFSTAAHLIGCRLMHTVLFVGVCIEEVGSRGHRSTHACQGCDSEGSLFPCWSFLHVAQPEA